jgi:L-asparaginase II
MANPVLVEITRGALVESVHRGSVAVVDAKGRVVFAEGDVTSLVYPRSALKPVQAFPLAASGALDQFGLGDEELALACASHSGAPMHTERVAHWLARVGCSESDLACGPHAPTDRATDHALIRAGERPCRLHNNCSGKHTGFVTQAKHIGAPIRGYEHPDHPVQQRELSGLRELSNYDGEIAVGVDGCAAPNFALPLTALAAALAKLGAPDDLAAAEADAARAVCRAMAAHPELIAGVGRPNTAMIRDTAGGGLAKTGAEGVYAAIIPKRGLGIALKIDDGAGRAAETAMAAILVQAGLASGESDTARLAKGAVKNTRGDIVGERRAAAALMNKLF